MKKLWGFVLIAALTLSSIASPLTMTSVRAEEMVNVVADVTDANDIKQYTKWETAIASASDGTRLTALANCNEKITIPGGKTIELDFGNYEYTRGLVVEENATLNVLGGTYQAGTFSSTAESWENHGTINIVNGAYNARVYSVETQQGWGFNIENYGTVNIQGGTFTGTGNIMSRNNGTAWGNTYITGGIFNKDGLGQMKFSNGNIYETNQHVFISKGTFCDSMKDLVTANMLSGADAVIVDFENGSFGVMTAAEAQDYRDAHATPTPEPTPTPTPEPTPTPTATPTPEPVVEVGDQVVLEKKDTSGANYVVASDNGKTATVKVTQGKNAKGSVSVPDKVTDTNGNTYKVTAIAGAAYKNNKKITSVSVGKNITTIGKDAFKGATKLSKADLSKAKVTSIEKNAFSGAKKLGSVKLNGNTLTKVGKDAFKGVKKNCKITITAKNKKTYDKLVKKIKASGAKKVKFVYKKGR